MKKLVDIFTENEKTVIGAGTYVGFVVLWQLLSSLKILDPIFSSHPLGVLETGIEVFASGTIYPHIWVSAQEFLLGFVAAVVVGIPVGLVMARVEAVNHTLSPFVYALYATPRMALFPLLIMWVGIGLWSKVGLVFLGALFPVLLNTFDGARNVDQGLIEVARSYGAKERDIFLKIVLIATIPFVVAGLRLSIGIGLIMMVVAEMLGSNSGLGFFIIRALGQFNTARIFVAAGVIVAFALMINWIAKDVERRMAPWLHAHSQ